MMKLGVAGLLPDWHQIDPAVAQKVRAAGFRGAQIFFPKPLLSDDADVRRAKHAFDEAGLEVAQANGWYECLVNPDDALRAEGVKGLQALCRIGRLLNTPSVYVRPGSLNPRGHWGPHPENHTPATFDRLVASLRKVCPVAAAEGVLLGIEGHVLSTLDTPRRVRDLFDAVASPVLKFNVDTVNFIGTVPDLYDTTRVINELFDLLGKDTIAAHMKDLTIEDHHVVHIKEVIMGTGYMDNGLVMRRILQCNPQAYLLIEHLPDELVPQARDTLVALADRIGIPLEM